MAESHGLHVEFYIDSVKAEFKSEEAGRPIHEDREFVRILIPGDNKTIIERIATNQDKDKFPVEYARFKNGAREIEQVVGTPLSQWPAMSRSLVKDFAALNVHTVEQLANLSDTGKQAFGMGGNEWAAKAKAYLDTAKDSAAAQQYAAENESLKLRIASMEAQFAELSRKVAEPEKRGPGRPPKQRTDDIREMVELD